MSVLLPSSQLLWLLGLAGVPLALGVFLPPLTWVGLGADGLILLLLAVDLVVTPGPGGLEIERRGGPVLAVGRENRLELVVRSRARVPLLVRLRESMPAGLEPARVLVEAAVGAGGEVILPYRVRPTRRGEYHFPPLAVRIRGWLGLSWRQARVSIAGSVRVYPDVESIRELELFAHRDRANALGVRPLRRLGRGTEFESLREYGVDDDFRAIDWKATARRGRAVARQYQLERSQPVMLLLDAGRLMTREFGGLSRLDHAIQAALLLGYVAMTRGDRVGLLSFGSRLEKFIPPIAGPAILPTLLSGLYDLEAELRESDYAGAFQALAARHRKRSLVVFFTEVSSLEASELLVSYLLTLVPRHLPLVVCIRDSDLQRRAEVPACGGREVLEKAAAITLVEEREEVLAQLERRGVLVVDAAPGALDLAVVNRYLELKARSRL